MWISVPNILASRSLSGLLSLAREKCDSLRHREARVVYPNLVMSAVCGDASLATAITAVIAMQPQRNITRSRRRIGGDLKETPGATSPRIA